MEQLQMPKICISSHCGLFTLLLLMDLIKKPWSRGINANKIHGKSMLFPMVMTFFFLKSKHGEWI
jgi:hypothetical protein